MSHPRLSVVAPCYNEEEGLREFLRRAEAACEATSDPFEIVLVNDGSRDGTWPLMQHLARTRPWLTCVNLSRNHGHQLALTAGLSICQGERILIIDADLQDPPELLAEMLRVRRERGADVVYGLRSARKGESRAKLWTASLFYRLIARLSDVPIPPDTGDFRLITRRALDVLLSMPERRRFIRGMVSWIGFTQVPLPYERDARFAGSTGYSWKKMARFACDALTSFSTRPLRLAGYAAALILPVSLSLGVWSLVAALRGLPAFAPAIAAAVCFLGAVQLLVLAVIGEYLGRLYEQSLSRPLFVIESITRGHDARRDPPGTRLTVEMGPQFAVAAPPPAAVRP